MPSGHPDTTTMHLTILSRRAFAASTLVLAMLANGNAAILTKLLS